MREQCRDWPTGGIGAPVRVHMPRANRMRQSGAWPEPVERRAGRQSDGVQGGTAPELIRGKFGTGD